MPTVVIVVSPIGAIPVIALVIICVASLGWIDQDSNDDCYEGKEPVGGYTKGPLTGSFARHSLF